MAEVCTLWMLLVQQRLNWPARAELYATANCVLPNCLRLTRGCWLLLNPTEIPTASQQNRLLKVLLYDRYQISMQYHLYLILYCIFSLQFAPVCVHFSEVYLHNYLYIYYCIRTRWICKTVLLHCRYSRLEHQYSIARVGRTDPNSEHVIWGICFSNKTNIRVPMKFFRLSPATNSPFKVVLICRLPMADDWKPT